MKKILSLLLVLIILIGTVSFAMINTNAASELFYLRGTFNGWSGIEDKYTFKKDSGNCSYLVITLDKGEYEYKYANEDWSKTYPEENAKLVLHTKSDVLFEFNYLTNMYQTTVLSGSTSFLSYDKAVNKVKLTCYWFEHNNEILSEKSNQMTYTTTESPNNYWDFIPAGNKTFYIQNNNTKNFVYYSGDKLLTTQTKKDDDSFKWHIDFSTGNYRILSAKDKRYSINVENQNSVANYSFVPAYYLSSQFTLEFSNYQYGLSENSVSDTRGNVIANNGTSMSSSAAKTKEWSLKEDISSIPKFTAANTPLLEAVYNLSSEEVIKNEFESKYGTAFYTGESWKKVWTRDTAMSCHFSLADILPDISLNCAKEKVVGTGNEKVFEEDTGSGGSYPVSSDKIITMLSVWEIYLSTGDKSVLEYFYPVCKNTIDQDYNVIYDEKSGLFKGETCGTDWRDQTYPDWVSETKADGLNNIADSKAASVNIIYDAVYDIMGKAAEILQKDKNEISFWKEKHDTLKKNISERFFKDDMNLYAAWEYPSYMGSPLPYKADVISNGYALLYNVGTEEQLKKISENYPLVTYGAPTVFPQKQGTLANANKIYHNRGVWPGWEAILMLGAKEKDNNKLATEIFNSCIRGCATSLTNKEVINYLTGEGVESNRQLWSIAGTLSGFYKVLFGMKYTEKGLSFSPCIPSWCNAPFTLNNFPYQKAKLNITLSGSGDKIKEIRVNDKAVDNTYMIPFNASGTFNISIIMEQQEKTDKINLDDEKNHVVCPGLPEMKLTGDTLSWNKKSDFTYKIYDGVKFTDVTGSSCKIDLTKYGSYSLVAIDKNGIESEMSKPIIVSPTTIKVEAESGTYKSGALKTSPAGYSGKGFINDPKASTSPVTVNINIEKEGTYLLECKYNNKGEPTSSNSCAIRSVYIDNTDVGSLVFPVSNFYYQTSTKIPVSLTKGSHTLTIKYDTVNFFDRNMNINTNNVGYDYFLLSLADDIFEKDEYYLLGDSNIDSRVGISDATVIQQYLAKLHVEKFDEDAADVNENGRVTIDDATIIQMHLAKFDTKTRIEQWIKRVKK